MTIRFARQEDLELPLESAEESAAVSWGEGDENSP